MGEQNQKMTSTWTHQENHCLYNEYVLILLEEKYFMSMKIPICEKEPQKGCLWYIITLMSDLRFRQRPEWDKAGEDLMASFIILPPSSCSVAGTTARSKGRVENWRLCSCLLRCRTLGFGEGFTTDKMIKPGPGQQYGSPLSLGPYLSLEAPTPVSAEHSWNGRAPRPFPSPQHVQEVRCKLLYSFRVDGLFS